MAIVVVVTVVAVPLRSLCSVPYSGEDAKVAVCATYVCMCVHTTLVCANLFLAVRGVFCLLLLLLLWFFMTVVTKMLKINSTQFA